MKWQRLRHEQYAGTVTPAALGTTLHARCPVTRRFSYGSFTLSKRETAFRRSSKRPAPRPNPRADIRRSRPPALARSAARLRRSRCDRRRALRYRAPRTSVAPSRRGHARRRPLRRFSMRRGSTRIRASSVRPSATTPAVTADPGKRWRRRDDLRSPRSAGASKLRDRVQRQRVREPCSTQRILPPAPHRGCR